MAQSKTKSAPKSAPSKRTSKPSKPSKSAASKSKPSATKTKSATKSKGESVSSRLRVPELQTVSEFARSLCCFNGPKSKRVETTQANPSTSRCALVVAAIGKGRKRAADTLGGKKADEQTGKRLGFSSLNAATEYAAGRVSNADVPIETRRAMSALAQAVAVADGGTRKPSQTKVNGRVLVAILVALATKG